MGGSSVFHRIALVALVAPLLALAPSAGPGAAAPATTAADEGAVHPEWGHTKGERGVLKKGCKKYHYTYSITPPEGDWALEVFISGPDVEHLGGGAFDGSYDPTTGRGTYTLCFVTTSYGRFTIEAKLSVANGPTGYLEGWLPTSHFRLHRPQH
jgi:hypothetical protein